MAKTFAIKARLADLKVKGAQQVARILEAFYPNDELYFCSHRRGAPVTRESAVVRTSWCARANAVYYFSL